MSNNIVILAERKKGTRTRVLPFFHLRSGTAIVFFAMIASLLSFVSENTRAEATTYHLAYTLSDGHMTTKRLVMQNTSLLPTSLVEFAVRFEDDPALGAAFEHAFKLRSQEMGVAVTSDLSADAPFTLDLILRKSEDDTLAEFLWRGGTSMKTQPSISGSSLIPRDSNAEVAAKRLAGAIAEDLALLFHSDHH